MNTKIFPFQIGEQYEKHEFKLSSICTKLYRGYEYSIYEYIGDDIIRLFELSFIKKPLLYYNADILARVEFIFDFWCYDVLLTKVNSALPEKDGLNENPFINRREAFKRIGNIAVEVKERKNEKTILCVSNYSMFFY